MKRMCICIAIISQCALGSNTLGPNPSMRKVIEPEERITPYKKSEFLAQYDKLVNNKETNKLLGSRNPLKYLSHQLINQWKLAANLLVSTVKGDAAFEMNTFSNTNETLVSYADELKKYVDELNKQVSLIIEQYPIYKYKKSLLKKTPLYTESDKNLARTQMQSTTVALNAIAKQTNRIKSHILLIETDTVTPGQEKSYILAIDFADKISKIAEHLAQGIKALK